MKNLSTIFNLGIPANWSSDYFNYTIIDSIYNNPIAATTVGVMSTMAVCVVIAALLGVTKK